MEYYLLRININYYGTFNQKIKNMSVSYQRNLKITKGKRTNKSERNLVFISKALFEQLCPKYKENEGLPIMKIFPIKEKGISDPFYYFFDIYEDEIEDNQIILDAGQRLNIGELNNSVSCEKAIISPAQPAEYVCFSMQKFRNQISGDYNKTDLDNYILQQFENNIICVGQNIGISFNGKSIRLVVKRFKQVSLGHGGNEKEALISSLMGKKEEDENTTKYVRIDSNTKFEYESSSDLKVKIVGQNVGFVFYLIIFVNNVL